MRAFNRSALLVVLIAGCRMGPGYERPETTPVMQGWRDSALALRDSSYANIQWWGVLNDTTLQGLIRVALRENRDLQIALARVNEARAQLGIARYDLYPQISIQGRAKTGEAGDSIFNGAALVNGFNSLGIGLNWEIDLWGRVRRLNESARASLFASEQGRRAVIITVVSEVARAYFEMRDLDAQRAITQTQVGIRQQSLDLARARFQGGLTSELLLDFDVSRSFHPIPASPINASDIVEFVFRPSVRAVNLS